MAVVLNAIQTGSTTLSTSDTSTTVTISSVDKTKSFLVYGLSMDESDPAPGLVAGEITNGTTLTFKRWSTSGVNDDVEIMWQVVEFTSGVSVQHGTTVGQNTPYTASLGSTVDLSKSFVLDNHYRDGATFSGDDYLTLELTDSGSAGAGNADQITFTCWQNQSADGYTNWQVIEYDDSDVQQGTVTVATGDTTDTATITSVDTTKAFLLMSDLGQNSTGNMGSRTWNASFNSATEIQFNRESTDSSSARTIAWQVVEFTGTETVQTGTQSFNSASVQENVTLSPVSQSGTLAMLQGRYQRQGRTPHNADDDQGPHNFTFELTSSTNLQISRGATRSSSATVDYAVIEFTADDIVIPSGLSTTSSFNTPSVTVSTSYSPSSLSGTASVNAPIVTLGESFTPASFLVNANVGQPSITLAGATFAISGEVATSALGSVSVLLPTVHTISSGFAATTALDTGFVAGATVETVVVSGFEMTTGISKAVVWESIGGKTVEWEEIRV